MNWPASAIRLASVSLSALTLLGLATACEKANDLGLELPGTSPISAQYQSVVLPVTTVRQQPIQTAQASHFLVGRVRDANVGATTAKAFLNVEASTVSNTLPSTYYRTTLDSVVLYLSFNQVYGTATKPLRFDLFQLQQPLNERQAYNSLSSVPTGTTLLTGYAGQLNRDSKVWQKLTNSKDSVLVTQPDRMIRVKMLNTGTSGRPSASAQTAALATTVFSTLRTDASFNQEKLDNVVKGFALSPSAGFEDNVVGFDRTNNTRIAFFYKGRVNDSDTAKVRSYVYNVFFGNAPTGSTSNAKFFTQLSTDFSGTRLAALNTAGAAVAPTADFPYSYVQDGVGLGTRIDLAGLAVLKDNTSQIINRAELRIPVRPYSTGLFPYAANIFLYEVDNQNQVLTRTIGATTYDRLVQSEGFINSSSVRSTPTGVFSPASATFPANLEPQYYTVNVTEYVQAYLRGEGTTGLNGPLPTGLLLSPILRSNLGLTLNRSLLDANNITLRVYYSKLQ